jgi:hypothetical protein
MRRRRSKPLARVQWSPSLLHLIDAAELECPAGHGAALAEFAALAMRKVPSRGIFDPGDRSEPELFNAVEAVARRHLGLDRAAKTLRDSFEAARLPFDQQDAIAQAALDVRGVSETAYFYAGLAFGLVFALGYRTA